MKKAYSFLVFLLWLVSSETLLAKSCIDWPKVFATFEIQRAEGLTLVQLDSFKNDSLDRADDWLSLGIPHLLGRLINTHGKMRAVLQKEMSLSKQTKPFSFRIDGLFQHQKGWLRIFVQLKNSQGMVIASHPIQTPYPLHQHFFSGLREAALTLLNKMTNSEVSNDPLKKIERETTNVLAFQNYIRGLEALRTFDPNQMEVALVWFQESRREDNQYIKAYEGLMETYGFLSLFRKANGETTQAEVEQMEGILREWRASVSKFAKKEEKERSPNSRFLEGAIHSTLGSKALREGKTSKATAELNQAVEQVPEDPSTYYYLALSYDKMKKLKEAAIFRQKALELNPCFESLPSLR